MSSFPPPPPPPPSSKRPKNKLVIAGIVAVIVVSLAMLVFLFMFQSGMVGNPFGPQAQVTAVSGHEGYQGMDTYYVDVTVVNNGNAGYLTVYAEISGGGKTEQQDQRVYVGTEDSRSLTFTFDLSTWGSTPTSSITYNAWATGS